MGGWRCSSEEEEELVWVVGETLDLPVAGLLEDVLDGLGEGEGLARAVGADDEHGGQTHRQGGGDGQDGLLLLGVQPGVQLLVPLPAPIRRRIQGLEKAVAIGPDVAKISSLLFDKTVSKIIN